VKRFDSSAFIGKLVVIPILQFTGVLVIVFICTTVMLHFSITTLLQYRSDSAFLACWVVVHFVPYCIVASRQFTFR
jgi:hypothetical protein